MGSSIATRADVSRLFSRAGFGATAADLDQWEGAPYADAVAHLLSGDTTLGAPPADDLEGELLASMNTYDAERDDAQLSSAQQWWLERMRTTTAPLTERMTLLWHDHFATAHSPMLPNTATMVLQNQTLRTEALGSFRELVASMTVDPAMLYWLDGHDSAAGAPNENYARELMELFALGTRPHVHTEQDVREAARVLTGWRAEVGAQRPISYFEPARHDDGKKTVLGHTIVTRGEGAEEHLELIDILLSQPAASQHVARTLVQQLAYPPSDRDPLVERVAQVLRSTDWNLSEAVSSLLLSEEFRHAPPGIHVRSPVQTAVHVARALDVNLRDPGVLTLLERAGQLPFRPPDVGGWPAGGGWLATTTAVARYDLGVLLYRRWREAPRLGEALPSPQDLEGWASRFGLAAFSPHTAEILFDHVAAQSGLAPEAVEEGVAALVAACPDLEVV